MLIIYANNGAKIVNLPLAVSVVDMFFEIFTFGQIWVTFFNTINNLYNGAKIVNLPLVVVEI